MSSASMLTAAIGRVGRNDNFFDLGGHSFIALRAVVKIQESSGVSIRPQLLVTSTMGEIAAMLASSDGHPDGQRSITGPAAVAGSRSRA